MAVSCVIFEIKRDIGRKSRFFHTPPPHSTSQLGGSRRNIAIAFGINPMYLCRVFAVLSGPHNCNKTLLYCSFVADVPTALKRVAEEVKQNEVDETATDHACALHR